MSRNKTIDKLIRDKLKELLPLCTKEQLELFNRMYSPKKLDASIEEVIDGLSSERFDTVMTQIESTIELNQNKLSKEFIKEEMSKRGEIT